MQTIESEAVNSLTNQKQLFQKWDSLLSDSFLGLLALITLFLAVTPSIFLLSPAIESILTIIENSILGLFLIEYLLSLYLSPNKAKFAFGFWRILDALIIMIALLALIPAIGDSLKHALSLRLLRFLRIALFSTKLRNAITVNEMNAVKSDITSGEVEASRISDSELLPTTWESIKTRLKNKNEDWLLAGNVNNNHISEVAGLLGVSPAHLSRLFFESQFPRIERMDNYTTLFLWVPSIVANKTASVPKVKREGLLLVGSDQNVLILSKHNIPQFKEVIEQSAEYRNATPFLPLMTWAFLKVISLRYVEIIDQLEKALFEIDAQQKSISDKVFLDTTFKLRTEITRLRSNIKHLSQAVRQLAEKPIAIKGFDSPPRSLFSALFDDMDSIYDRADDLLNNVSALVELRLNISSFQMNKVMRLLAILTTLTLIPAITGGMLGMNLMDNPWPLSLAEVSFCVAAGISISLYIFAVKGWFK